MVTRVDRSHQDRSTGIPSFEHSFCRYLSRAEAASAFHMSWRLRGACSSVIHSSGWPCPANARGGGPYHVGR